MDNRTKVPHAELMDLVDLHAEDRVRAGQSPKTYISREALSDFARTLTDRIAELERTYSEACKLVADMHLAAVGEVKGPKRGVVEDVEDLRIERDDLRAQLEAVGAGGVGAMMPAKKEPTVPDNMQAMLAAAPAPPKAETPLTGNEEVDRIIARLDSSDPDFDDCADAVALFIKMVEESKGPDGFASWKDAAIAARISASPAVVEPFGYFKAEPFGWTDCAESDEGAIALYEAPPPPAQAQTTLAAAPPPHQIAEPASPWVSVAERLPIQDQEPYQVLSICKKRHGEDCNYPGQGIKRVSQDWVIRQWPQNFTHWMAIPILPATPKEPS